MMERVREREKVSKKIGVLRPVNQWEDGREREKGMGSEMKGGGEKEKE